MDEKYWDKMAADYDGEIFSALANDRRDVIVSYISQFADPQAIAADFGCGVGKFLPVLAENFSCVHAFDISNKLLKEARQACSDLDNITFAKADLSKGGLKLPKAVFALSVNVAIMPSQKKRAAIFDTISKHLNKAAHLLLVVLSLESALYADFRLVQWNLKTGLTPNEAASELEEQETTDVQLRQGIIDIEGVPTKHYLKEELLALFKERDLDVLGIEKVEYPWHTEFESPPTWMSEPYPWDWLFVLQKNN